MLLNSKFIMSQFTRFIAVKKNLNNAQKISLIFLAVQCRYFAYFIIHVHIS